VYLSVCKSIYVGVYMSVCVAVCLSGWLWGWLSVAGPRVRVCSCVSAGLSVCMHVCRSVCRSVRLSVRGAVRQGERRRERARERESLGRGLGGGSVYIHTYAYVYYSGKKKNNVTTRAVWVSSTLSLLLLSSSLSFLRGCGVQGEVGTTTCTAARRGGDALRGK